MISLGFSNTVTSFCGMGKPNTVFLSSSSLFSILVL